MKKYIIASVLSVLFLTVSCSKEEVSLSEDFVVSTDDEINYYVNTYQPFDKAGGYGIQEWLGYVGINKIEGSFFNVMGLPTHLVYKTLLNIAKK